MDNTPARPFIIWPGGKRRLLAEIRQRIPLDISAYWEPFVGGGAVYFSLVDRIRRAHLSDANPEITAAYRAVKHSPQALIEALADLARRHAGDPRVFYEIRATDPIDDVGIAARLIYLTKTCFSGRYEVNRQGRFSNSLGKLTRICNPDVIMSAHRALAGASIPPAPGGSDFADIRPGAGHFVYGDPPYLGSRRRYTARDFSYSDHVRLRDAALAWADAGAHVMLSNFDSPEVRALYDSGRFRLHPVSVGREISGPGARSWADSELLITTYEAPNV